LLRTWVGQSSAGASPVDIRWLGFSYVAFRLIHTLRDRQAGRLPAVTLRDYLNYVIFFPAISAGPIDKLQRFDKDLQKPLILNVEVLGNAFYRLVVGIFKKFAVADTIALIALNSQNAGQIQANGWGWIMVYAYAFQIYFDFSGYTDIAIGLGQLLGIQLPENFNRPYLKPNLTQFWNNWHMTLTQWFRAYFFNPFTRSLRTRYRTLSPTLVILITQVSTMVLIGLWHGITWNFVLWGVWHGLGLFLQNRYSDWVKPRMAQFENKPRIQKGMQVLNVILSFHFVALGWVWFALPKVTLSITVFTRLLGFGS
jgi:D-alanyl-lipoteichoic acid acyltransferase DltB (MBOAT superfamily)